MARYVSIKPHIVEAISVAEVLSVYWSARHEDALPEWLEKAHENREIVFFRDSVRLYDREGEWSGVGVAMWLINTPGGISILPTAQFATEYKLVGVGVDEKEFEVATEVRRDVLDFLGERLAESEASIAKTLSIQDYGEAQLRRGHVGAYAYAIEQLKIQWGMR